MLLSDLAFTSGFVNLPYVFFFFKMPRPPQISTLSPHPPLSRSRGARPPGPGVGNRNRAGVGDHPPVRAPPPPGGERPLERARETKPQPPRPPPPRRYEPRPR